jgi:signal transduction protein with GAF and PtsI domain
MQASRIAPIKLLIRSVDLSKLAPRLQAAMDDGDQSIRNAMLSIAQDSGLKI